MINERFENRHIGPRKGQETEEMLKKVGVSSFEELIDKTMPDLIRSNEPLDLPEELSEYQYLDHMKKEGAKNKEFRSFIGMGYYDCFVPPVIQRNVLENPGWYTPYTPYQAEIAQGRLEALLNFQTMVMDLTGMEIANASLLDEPTAAAEAMLMFHAKRSRKASKEGVNKFFVSEEAFPQTIEVLYSRANNLNIELVIGDHEKVDLSDGFFGALVQYPSGNGEVYDYKNFIEKAHETEVMVAVAADLLSLTLLTPPGEWNADAVLGTTQRFGVPMGYGGPHAAYFATREEFKRNIPGRIIGVSKDAEGKQAVRMALQTREQHIRKDKATSNICTAQALLAVMASMYGVYHGPTGLKRIADDIHRKTVLLADHLAQLGVKVETEVYFDTLQLTLPEGVSVEQVRKIALENEINLRYFDNGPIGISLDETTTVEDLNNLLGIFSKATGKTATTLEKGQWKSVSSPVKGDFVRKSDFLEESVFTEYHSETELMRYLKRLENKDMSLTHSMIPLGSCTMKLNAVSELYPISWPEFAGIHPFVPKDQVEGYLNIINSLGDMLKKITGFHGISFQPNSGAQGEFAGLKMIRAYHENNGDDQRKIALIPSSAHGTNPASAVMAGMKVVMVKCDDHGNIDVEDLRTKAEKYSDELSALMVTYPSTHGVFEESIKEINAIVHEHGGQVYMDGANMNAQVGYTNPATVGADVCHLNLHKTFAIPHGGGGPGMGPIGVAKQLVPFLPGDPLKKDDGQAIHSIASTHFGSALILLISYGYIRMLGEEGLANSTNYAILNTNYLKKQLEGNFNVLYTGVKDMVAHEMILDCREFKKTANIEVEDIAKRLIDYGFHAPTISFPVPGTLMVEPTESESIHELDRFVEAMKQIREEIAEIEKGVADPQDNVLKNAPHTAACVATDQWEHNYPREKAAYPLKSLYLEHKFWSPVRRVDNAYGDRNLMCSCPPLEAYEEDQMVEP